MARYRIVSFDGGGVRGMFSATIVRRITAVFPDWLQRTHLFSGTSAGAFLALGLASGKTPDEVAVLFSERTAAYVFQHPRALPDRPKYSRTPLMRVLQAAFPSDLCLNDLGAHVVIPSFRLAGPNRQGAWGPVFFHNYPGSETGATRVIDAALASSAAPVYFPSYHGYVDGGVFANNPATAAIALAADEKAGGQCLRDIAMLSIGTGCNPYRITSDTQKWGAMQWAIHLKADNPNEPEFPLLALLLDGASEADTRYASQFLNNRFLRVNLDLGIHTVPLDGVKSIPRLRQWAEAYDLTEVLRFVGEHWYGGGR